MYEFHLGSISNTLCGPRAPLGVIPKHKAKKLNPEHFWLLPQTKENRRKRNILYALVFLDCYNKLLLLDGLNNRNTFSHNPGKFKSKVKVQSGKIYFDIFVSGL